MLCKVGALLLEPDPNLPPEDQGYLATVLADPELVPATALSEALRLEGHPVGPTTIKDHRAGRCSCA